MRLGCGGLWKSEGCDGFDPRRVEYCGSKDECLLFEDDADRLGTIRDA